MFTRPLTDTLDNARLAALGAAGARVERIGASAAGRPLYAYTLGNPALPLVSMVAGAHPDEPAGPLAALALAAGWAASDLHQLVRLAVVPQLDGDGCRDQRAWLVDVVEHPDLLAYARHRQRRLLGADREFAWPGAPWGGQVLPENAAAAAFFTEQGPARAHLSLHGMGCAGGAWFLLDEAALRDQALWHDLRRIAAERHLGLHDSPRHGAKGFRRSGRGFCTCPSGPAMRRWALAAGRRHEAAVVAYSSMDHARLLARRAGRPAPLCAVSEFPLFISAHADGAPPAHLRAELAALPLADDPAAACSALLARYGIRSVPLSEQVSGMVAMTHAVIRAALRQG